MTDSLTRSGSSADQSPLVKTVLGPEEMSRTITRMAHQLLEIEGGADDLILLGIPTRGVPLAHRLAAALAAIENHEIPVGTLDITMYRDDLRNHPTRAVGKTKVPKDIEGQTVVLVDDVLFGGRTVAAALDAIKDLGRPKAIRLAILVDRGHRQFPIRADVVGKELPTSRRETVRVLLTETDGEDAVRLTPERTPNA